MSAPRWFGFQKESTPGPETTPQPRIIAVIGLDEEMCEICECVGPRDEMHYIGVDGGGMPYYVCGNSHPKGGT